MEESQYPELERRAGSIKTRPFEMQMLKSFGGLEILFSSKRNGKKPKSSLHSPPLEVRNSGSESLKGPSQRTPQGGKLAYSLLRIC